MGVSSILIGHGVRRFGDTKIADEDEEIDTVGQAVDKIEQYIDASANAA